MTILKSIEQSQLLTQQLVNNATTTDEQILTALSKELKKIAQFAQQLTRGITATTIPKPEMKSGCYIFANEKGFFCPNCYDNSAQKVTTKRINSQLRVCPACRISIK